MTAVASPEDPEPNNKQEVQFSEAMDPSTINAQTFTVTDSSGHAVGGVVSYDASYKIASFQPSPALQPIAKYTAVGEINREYTAIVPPHGVVMLRLSPR